MRQIAALLLAAVLLLALPSCQLLQLPAPSASPPSETGTPDPTPDPTPTGTRVPFVPTPRPSAAPEVFTLAYDPNGSLDPIRSTNAINRELVSLVYQGLFTVDETFAYENVLAERTQVSWDGLTWTVSLKEGVCFSDGTPITLQQVMYVLNQARNSDVYRGRLANIQSIYAGDDVLVIGLAVPDSNLPCLLDVPIYLDGPGPAPLGSGYYVFNQGEDGSLYLTKNPMHVSNQGLPWETIPLVPVADEETRMQAFHSGTVSLVTADLTGLGSLGYAGGQERTTYPTSDMVYAGFQTTAGPTQDPLIRRAISRLLDRDAIVSELMNGIGTASALPVHPVSFSFSQEVNNRLSADPQAAEMLLEQAGCTRNEEDGLLYWRNSPLTLRILVNSGNELRQQIAKRLSASLTALGITAPIEIKVWNQYVSTLESGDFDIYLGEVILPADFDFSALTSGPLNYGGFETDRSGETAEDAVLYPLLYTWRGVRQDAKEAAAAELWAAFANSVPFAPICFRTGTLLIRWGMAANVQPTQADLFRHMEEWQTERLA